MQSAWSFFLYSYLVFCILYFTLEEYSLFSIDRDINQGVF